MTTRNSLVPIRIAAIALAMTAAGAAHAEADDVVPTALAVPYDYGVSEEVDPLVRQEILGLRSNGLIEFQSQIGSDLLAIDRLQRRAHAVQGLLAVLGTDGLRQFDPKLYAAMENSPIVIRQRIEELQLRRELEEADTDEVKPEDFDDLIERIGRTGPVDPISMAPFGPGPAAAEEVVIAEPEVPTFEDVVESKPAEPVIEDFAISLREILGSNGEYRAVILHGTELIRIEAGDMLPNDTEILEVMDDRIKVRRRDMTFDIHLRG